MNLTLGCILPCKEGKLISGLTVMTRQCLPPPTLFTFMKHKSTLQPNDFSIPAFEAC